MSEADRHRTLAEAAKPDTAGSTFKDRVCLPDHLPRKKMTLDLAPDHCPCCGGAVHEVRETVSEMLDHIPARLCARRIHRPKYGCRACGTIHQAPRPRAADRHGLRQRGLLAQVLVLVAKYCDHLPL